MEDDKCRIETFIRKNAPLPISFNDIQPVELGSKSLKIPSPTSKEGNGRQCHDL